MESTRSRRAVYVAGSRAGLVAGAQVLPWQGGSITARTGQRRSSSGNVLVTVLDQSRLGLLDPGRRDSFQVRSAGRKIRRYAGDLPERLPSDPHRPGPVTGQQAGAELVQVEREEMQGRAPRPRGGCC